MQIIRDLTTFKKLRKNYQHKIGMVATMGSLHAGHLSLIERSKQDNDITVMSLFVNPTQFNDPNDFKNYPMTEQQDIQLATQAQVDWLLMPEKQAMYPNGDDFSINSQHLLNTILEAQQRPGHLTGVMTVVMKLLQLVKPHNAYFGEKDFQQLTLIKQMAESFFIDTNIIGCPTLREESMLPYSSRNNKLTTPQKEQANQFSKVFHSDLSIKQMIAQLTAANIKIEYIESYNNRLFAAINIGTIRIIDNKLIKDAT